MSLIKVFGNIDISSRLRPYLPSTCPHRIKAEGIGRTGGLLVDALTDPANRATIFGSLSIISTWTALPPVRTDTHNVQSWGFLEI